MTFKLIAPLVAVGLALSFSSLATAKEANATAAKPAGERKICRAGTGTGTIMRARICHTKAEWDVIDGANGSRAGNQLDLRDRSSASGIGVN